MKGSVSNFCPHSSADQEHRSSKARVASSNLAGGTFFTSSESYERELMCKACAEACREVFPEVPDDKMWDFLMSTTCFPCGDAPQVRSQLVKNRDQMITDDWQECYAIADRELDEAMLQNQKHQAR